MCFISSDNILEIGPDCEAVLAKYEQGEGRPVVLLVLYPDRAAAERAFANLSRKFHLPANGGEAVKLADKKYFAAGLENRCRRRRLAWRRRCASARAALRRAGKE